MRPLQEFKEPQLSRRHFLHAVSAGVASTALASRSLFAEEKEPQHPEFLRGQEKTNACGTTCVQMLLSRFGDTVERKVIDSEIRKMEAFGTNPSHIVRYLEQSAYRAALSSNTEDEDLIDALDKGLPAIVLVDPLNENAQKDTEDWSLHYQLIYDYKTEKDAKMPTHFVLCDPGGKGSVKTIPYNDFMRSWSNLQVGNVETGIHKLMITAVPDNDVEIKGKDAKERKASDIQLSGDGKWGNPLMKKMFDTLSARNLSSNK